MSEFEQSSTISCHRGGSIRPNSLFASIPLLVLAVVSAADSQQAVKRGPEMAPNACASLREKPGWEIPKIGNLKFRKPNKASSDVVARVAARSGHDADPSCFASVDVVDATSGAPSIQKRNSFNFGRDNISSPGMASGVSRPRLPTMVGVMLGGGIWITIGLQS